MDRITRQPATPERGRTLAAFVAGSADRDLPQEVISAAKTALVDHVGVAIGGMGERASLGARQMAEA